MIWEAGAATFTEDIAQSWNHYPSTRVGCLPAPPPRTEALDGVILVRFINCAILISSAGAVSMLRSDVGVGKYRGLEALAWGFTSAAGLSGTYVSAGGGFNSAPYRHR